MGQVYEQMETIAMNESQLIEILNQELFIIGHNTLVKYEREQGRLEAEEKYKDEIAELKAEIARLKSLERK